jgi:hypothetical protein
MEADPHCEYRAPNIELSRAAACTGPMVYTNKDSERRDLRRQLLRVALGGYPPKAPTVPHERISRMRFFKP